MSTSEPRFKLAVGLGNPDKQYQNTYHNAGYLFIDYLKNQNLGVKCKMLKSGVYMNNSGAFIANILKKSGIKPEELLIVQDDSDIYLGDYKLSFNRGSAGHKGIESIIRSLETKKFWRLRIGIRMPARPAGGPARPAGGPARPAGGPAARLNAADDSAARLKAEKFVLKKISAAHRKTLENLFKKISGGYFD